MFWLLAGLRFRQVEWQANVKYAEAVTRQTSNKNDDGH